MLNQGDATSIRKASDEIKRLRSKNWAGRKC